ncbi:16S rRNA (guanine(966)-N(2))-methyltransferase RsmD [Gilvimarinus sp. F26214L]|uniref:16S rRNA (guanine(966)-N(2))-methyltransferase RsmD n=1 Tax=Gilvimarinus sp. DZF01 TaxID=3461371 RepID=UPI00404558E2
MKSSPRRPARNQLRIIGGKWRGRKLDFPSLEGLRPTGDRIRETLFNWLAPTLPGARCLDLFAGSGALGLEALSRDAEEAVLLDADPRIVATLRGHMARLEANNGTVEQADALQWLRRGGTGPFDVVFIDPPFQAGLLEDAAEALNDSGSLGTGALVYVEHDRKQSFAAPVNWTLLKHKAAGQVSYALYQYDGPSTA